MACVRLLLCSSWVLCLCSASFLLRRFAWSQHKWCVKGGKGVILLCDGAQSRACAASWGWVWMAWVWMGWMGTVWMGWIWIDWVWIGWVWMVWVWIGWVWMGWIWISWVWIGWVWMGWVWMGWVWMATMLYVLSHLILLVVSLLSFGVWVTQQRFSCDPFDDQAPCPPSQRQLQAWAPLY